MYLEIFDVEHGACALINTSNGKRVMIDCGHNAATNWRPGYHLARFGINFIDRLYVTNFDEDHVSGFPNLSDYVRIGALFTNPTVAPSTVRYLKTEDGMGVGIERLVLCMEHVFTGGRPPAFEDYGDTSFTTYWKQYGLLGGFTDENNLSLVVFVTCGQHKFIFPGDMETEGWRQLLRNPAFVAELHGVNVFVASHHGRENGYCEEVLNLCPAIEVFIISDKHTGAYWLLLDLRAAITSWNPLRHTEFATIRLRLLKIAGRFIEHRISRIWLASGDRQLVRSMR